MIINVAVLRMLRILPSTKSMQTAGHLIYPENRIALAWELAS